MKNILETSEAFSSEVLLCYFDLRKFSYIENNFDVKKIFSLLNEMHELITAKIEENNGYNLRYIGDNTLAVFEKKNICQLVRNLKNIKLEVDALFKAMNTPCVLHCLLHAGKGHIGPIGGLSNKRPDVNGPVLNRIGYLMMRVDTSNDYELFNSYAISEDVFNLISEEQQKHFTLKKIDDVAFYI